MIKKKKDESLSTFLFFSLFCFPLTSASTSPYTPQHHAIFNSKKGHSSLHKAHITSSSVMYIVP
jgi:hypothetical protein